MTMSRASGASGSDDQLGVKVGKRVDLEGLRREVLVKSDFGHLDTAVVGSMEPTTGASLAGGGERRAYVTSPDHGER